MPDRGLLRGGPPGGRIAVEAAVLIPDAKRRRVQRLVVSGQEAARLNERQHLALARPDAEVVFVGVLLRVEQRPRADPLHAADPHPRPVIHNELRRVVARVLRHVEEPDHLLSIRIGPEPLAVALRKADLVEQGIRPLWIILREALEEFLAVELRVGSRVDLCRHALAVEQGVDDVLPVDGQGQRLAKAAIVEQPAFPHGFRTLGIDAPVDHRIDGELRPAGRIPVVHRITATRCFTHQENVVLVPDKPVLHAQLAARRGEAEHRVGPDFHHQPVEIGQLVALRVDRAVVRIAHEHVRPGRRVRTIDPRP